MLYLFTYLKEHYLEAAIIILTGAMMFFSLHCLPGNAEVSWRNLLVASSLLSLFSLGVLFRFHGSANYSVCSIDYLVLLLSIFIFIYSFLGAPLPNPLSSLLLPLMSVVLYWTLRILFMVKGNNVECLIVFVLSVFSIKESFCGLLQCLGVVHSHHILFPATGHFQNPGPYGCFIAVTGVSSLSYLIRNISKRQTSSLFAKTMICLTFVSSLLSLIMLPVINSRAAIIGFICGICVFLGTQCRKFQRTLYYIIFFVILALSVLLLYYIKKDSADGRVLIYKMALKAIIDSRGLGYGWGAFQHSYGKIQCEYFATGNGSLNEIRLAGCPRYAFNEYLQLGVEGGILPMAIFITMSIIVIWHLAKNNSVLVSVSVALYVSALFSYPLQVMPLVLVNTFLLAYSASVSPSLWIKTVPPLILFIITTISLCLLIVSIKHITTYLKTLSVFESAHTLYSVGAYESAIDKYASITSCTFLPIEYYYEYGHALHRMGRWDESNEYLKIGSERSNDPMFHNIIGKNHQAKGMISDAEEEYTVAHFLVPNRLYPLYLLAVLYYENGQREKFDAIAKEVMNFNPKVPSQITDSLKKQIQYIVEQNN